jgi:hypothetical protein
LPRSLKDHRAIRRELVALYGQGKRGLIDPKLLGRLAHVLSLLAGLVRDIDLEARLAALEHQAALERWPIVERAEHHLARH